MPHIVLYTCCEVATSKALKVKVPGFDVDDNGTVVKVNFSSHRIGDAEATALAEALKENTSLKEIGLQGNQIKAAGKIALLEANVQMPT